MNIAFESSVNSEGIETVSGTCSRSPWFESSVNSEGIETIGHEAKGHFEFESSVNSEGIETDRMPKRRRWCLRAV